MEDPLVSVEKILGADFEFANAFFGDCSVTAGRAAEALLAQIPGYPRRNQGGTVIEYGRRFLPTCGSSWYIDSDHLEGNLPEHRSAFDHPNALHGAGFAQAQAALRAVKANLPQGVRLNLLANCSDGNTSWGSHLNVMVTRRCFEDMHERKPHLAAFFATHLVTSVMYTGQGLVGAANGRSPCTYQLSQRADWFETFAGQQTMVNRPLINLRDESHAENDLARVHIIFLDMVLSPVAAILRAGTAQLVLALIEAGWSDPTLCLDDPVAAASAISRDLRMCHTHRTTVRGRRMSALEIQQEIAQLAGEFIADGRAEGVVPHAEEIVALWLDTLDLARRRELTVLAGRCDAWLKYLMLDAQRGKRNLPWSSNAMRMFDSLFASLDPEVSLFFQAAQDGCVERMPDEATVRQFATEPPDDTRAYFRAHVLRRFGHAVSSMDWSRIRFRVPGARHWWATAEIPMRDPRRFHRAESEVLFQQCTTLEELVDAANTLALDDSPATEAEESPSVDSSDNPTYLNNPN